MRKPRDFDAELKALDDKAKETRKIRQLGELVITTGADALTANELAGALIVLAETKEAAKRGLGRGAGLRSFRDGRGELHRHLTVTLAALRRNRSGRNRSQVARAGHEMRTWQVERRKRTRHLIELGGLVDKAGIVELTGGDRAAILGALLWMAEKLQSDQCERARALWVAKGKQAFETGGNRSNCSSRSTLMHDNGMSAK
jgi:hypothetical protein